MHRQTYHFNKLKHRKTEQYTQEPNQIQEAKLTKLNNSVLDELYAHKLGAI